MEQQTGRRLTWGHLVPGGALAVLLVLSMMACRPQGTVTAGDPSTPNTSSVITEIDWVSFLKFNGITYEETGTKPGRALLKSDVGSLFAIVRFKVADVVHDPGYQIQDGDAAFLKVGTPVYQVKGYKPTFRLTAFYNDRWTLFEVARNPKATQGAELLDISGKVQSIGINSDQGDGTTPLGAIKDPVQVNRLVQMVLTAQVRQPTSAGVSETRYFIVFYFLDGTTTVRAYFRQSRELQSDIYLPNAFGQAIEQAVGH